MCGIKKLLKKLGPVLLSPSRLMCYHDFEMLSFYLSFNLAENPIQHKTYVILMLIWLVLQDIRENIYLSVHQSPVGRARCTPCHPPRNISNTPFSDQSLDIVWDNNSPSPARTLSLGKILLSMEFVWYDHCNLDSLASVLVKAVFA